MKLALQVTSWIAVVLGAFAILGSMSGEPDAIYSLVGGLLFLGQGVLALAYINQKG